MHRAVVLSCALAAVVGLGACSSSGGSPANASGAGSSGGSVARSPVPATCDEVPPSVLEPYATVRLVKSFPTPFKGVSCQFGSADGAQIVVLTIGPGSDSSFELLKLNSNRGAVTTAPLEGLGSQAFTINSGGKVVGVDVLTHDRLTISVAAVLPTGQLQELAARLVARY